MLKEKERKNKVPDKTPNKIHTKKIQLYTESWGIYTVI